MEPVTDPGEQLIELLTCTQRHWLVAMEYPRNSNITSIHFAASYFSAAWYLRALIEGHPLEDTCTHLAEILMDGGGIGEWTWDLLVKYGIDPDTITPAGVKPESAASVSAPAFLRSGRGVMLGRALSEWRSYWDDSGESGAPGDVELALVQAYDAVSAAGPDGEGQTEEVEYLVWSNEAQQWWKANGAGYTHRIFSAGRYNRAEAVKACNMRTWSLGTIPPEVMVPAPPAALLDAMQAIHDEMPAQIQAANIARIAERNATSPTSADDENVIIRVHATTAVES